MNLFANKTLFSLMDADGRHTNRERYVNPFQDFALFDCATMWLLLVRKDQEVNAWPSDCLSA
jgi:hypothetical protein